MSTHLNTPAGLPRSHATAWLGLFIFLSFPIAARASGSRVLQDFSSLQSAIKMYKVTTGRLPARLDDLVERPAGFPATVPWAKMMSEIPQDPWGNPYRYVLSSDLPDGYGIYSKGKDGETKTIGNDPDDFNSWTKWEAGHPVRPETDAPSLMTYCLSVSGALGLGMYLGGRWRRGHATSNLVTSA